MVVNENKVVYKSVASILEDNYLAIDKLVNKRIIKNLI